MKISINRIDKNSVLLILLYITSIIDVIIYKQVSFVFLCILMGYYFWFINGMKIRRNEILLYLFVLVITFSAMLNIIISNVNFGAILRPLRIGMTLLVGYIYGTKSTENERKTFYSAIFLISVIGIIWGIIQYFTGNVFESNHLRTRIASFFVHPNIFGSILVGTIWFVYYLVENNLKKWIYTVFFVVAIFSTSSRSSWIAIAIFAVAFFLFKFVRKRTVHFDIKRIMLFISILGCVFAFIRSKYFMIAINYISSRFNGSWEGLMETKGARYRVEMLITIIRSFFSSNYYQIIFGHGPKSVNYASFQENVMIIEGITSADNQIITFFYEYGIIGFLFLTSLIVLTVRNLNNKENEIKWLVYAIDTMFFTAFFYELFGWKSICTLFMLFIGIFLSLVLNKDASKKRLRKYSKENIQYSSNW